MEWVNYILHILYRLWSSILLQIDSKGIWANFLGGLAVVLFLFFYKELFRSNKNLSGEWGVINTVENSDYNPYVSLKVIWKMHILQNGDSVSGSGEKIKDIQLDGLENEFEPTKRESVEITGYIEKNYFHKSRVFINVIQFGQLRKSRATYILKYESDSRLVGTFVTTAGNSRGTSVFIKNA
ncbi:MAG: hypothetical protein UW86_C0028G0008 [Microgenomates group bacterium GW2011_GWA1_Microgenomates_45_10]|nr:MAG: hypothetical protein UW86_C0028G0008 [Microgenomates group bacterium GW2011_GWA1_Microgenomates_45_10]